MNGVNRSWVDSGQKEKGMFREQKPWMMVCLGKMRDERQLNGSHKTRA